MSVKVAICGLVLWGLDWIFGLKCTNLLGVHKSFELRLSLQTRIGINKSLSPSLKQRMEEKRAN